MTEQQRGAISAGARRDLQRHMMAIIAFLAVNDESQISEKRLRIATQLRQMARNLLDGLNASGQPPPPPPVQLLRFDKHASSSSHNPNLDYKHGNGLGSFASSSSSSSASASDSSRARGAKPSNLVVQAGNMTGDMFGMAAALVLDPTLHVVILSEGSMRDKTRDLCKFYLLSLGDHGFDLDGRIHVLQVADMSREYTQYASQRLLVPAKDCIPPLPQELCNKNRQKPINFSTVTVAAKWVNNPKKCRLDIRARWRVEDPDVNVKIGRFLSGRGIPVVVGDSKEDGDSKEEQGNRMQMMSPRLAKRDLGYVVLWSRFSGKKGGPHAQHDTSFTAMRQLIELARYRGKIVIITGDHNPTRSSVAKYAEMCKREGVFNIVEFWKDKDWLALFSNDYRTAQFAVYDCLNRCAFPKGNLKHLGFRSGNLEVYAVLGHQVRYLEERTNLQAVRMIAWSTDKTTKKQQLKSTAIGYDRIVVSKSPTLTGQWIVERADATKSEDKAPWIVGPELDKRTFMKPSFSRGFEYVDLLQIEGYLADRDVGELHRERLASMAAFLERMQAGADAQRLAWSQDAEMTQRIEDFNLSEARSEFDFDDFDD